MGLGLSFTLGSRVVVAVSELGIALGPFQLHLQDFTTMLDSCSTFGVLPT